MADVSDKRFVADEKSTPADFKRLAERLGLQPLRARKVGLVAARRADQSERVETLWNGKETTNAAAPGDWIVTNLASDGKPLKDASGHLNIYVISAARFDDLYEPAGKTMPLGKIYRAKGIVRVIPLPGGFDILAPWGERQQAVQGYLILNGDEVYGNNAETFEATYEVLSD